MKRLALVVVFLFAMTMCATAQISFYGGGGINMPMGPEEFKDYMKMGKNFCGGVSFNLSPSFEIGGTIAYNTMGPDFDKLLDELSGFAGTPITGIEIDGFDTKALEFLGEAKFVFGGEDSKMKPYVLGCVGMAKLSLSGGTVKIANAIDLGDGLVIDPGTYEISDSDVDTSETKLTWGFGAGLDFVLSPKLNLFVEARYMMITVSDEDLGVDEEVGVDPTAAGVSSDDIVHMPIRVGLRLFLGGDDY